MNLGYFVLILYSGLYIVLGVLYARTWAMEELTKLHKIRADNNRKIKALFEEEKVKKQAYLNAIKALDAREERFRKVNLYTETDYKRRDLNRDYLNMLDMYTEERIRLRNVPSNDRIYVKAVLRFLIWPFPVGWVIAKNTPLAIGKLIMWRRPLTKFEIQMNLDMMAEKIAELEKWNKENDPTNRETEAW